MRQALAMDGEVEVRVVEPEDESVVVALWEANGLTRPWNDPAQDVRRKLVVRDGLFLVATADGCVIGSVMAGYEGHRGWINYLAVDSAKQRSGIGRMLMSEAERRLAALGCPKINLQVRATNVEALGFYEQLGYATDDVVSLGKRLVEDDARPI
jgi:ribosomal protein S18 acetylase RimI-like enzyme